MPSQHSPIPRRAEGTVVPLTPLQSATLKAAREHGPSIRMCAAAVRILGPLESDALCNSFRALIQRHESLRTRIIVQNGIARQHIDTDCVHDLGSIDLRALPRNHVEAQAIEVASEFINQRIDLCIEPLFEAKLLQFSSCEHALLATIHHIVSDAVSCAIINRELWQLYIQRTTGTAADLRCLPIQFPDYAVWQEQMCNSWRIDHQAYWKKRLAGAPSTRIPLDDGLTEMEHPVGSMLHFCLGRELTWALREVATREETRLPVVVLAIHALVMAHWCNQDEIVLAFISHGRDRPELENMVGFLATFTYLRIKLDKGINLLDFLRRVRLELDAASAHRHYSSYVLGECTTEVLFNWLPNDRSSTSGNGGVERSTKLRVQPLPVNFVWPAIFSPFYHDTAAGVCMSVHFRADRLRSATIKRFGRNLRYAAEQFAGSPLTCTGSVLADLQ